MENKISECITGFRKSHGTQHSLLVMLEKFKKALDREENISAIFMDLSKAFDTINHDLLFFFFFFFLFYLGFLSRTFTIHGTAGEGGGYLFNSSLPLPPASQTLRH